MVIRSHSVPILDNGLSAMQERLLRSEKYVRLVAAPTGSGKSYAFMRAVLDEDASVLFIVPTKRLLQNLIDDAREQASQRFHGRFSSEDELDTRIEEQVVEWSGNQPKDGSDSLGEARVRQLLAAGAPTGRVVFAIPEVVVKMISGVQITGGTTVNPFSYPRRFDHIVIDEFHTIDDRSFGLACLLSLLAVTERQGRVSLLSATPIDITKILEKAGVEPDDVERISENVVEGHPRENRPIHGNVTLTVRDCALHESFALSIDDVRVSIDNHRTVVIIYDSLARLKNEEPAIRKTLIDAGLAEARVLVINTIDDSERKPGEPHRGRRYKDPREYDVLVSTSSIEVGVTFRSTLMFMEPGFGVGSFMQRVGRVSRGREDGRVIVSLPEHRRNRHAWIRGLAKVVEKHEDLTAQDFAAEVLRDARRRLEPREEDGYSPGDDDGRVPSYGRASWRGAYWAALFIVAVRRTKMTIQRAARERLYRVSSPLVKWVDGRIREIVSIEMVNDNLPRRSQPHKRWVNALLAAALAYRDIGATVVVVEPDGTRHTATESFLRRETELLDCHVVHDEDGERVIHLMSGSLDEAIRASSSGVRRRNRLVFHVPSPIGVGDFAISINERGKGTEQLHRRLVEEWRDRFRGFIPERGDDPRDPRQKVMSAATALVEKLGRPPLSEDHDGEGAMFA